MTSEHPNPRLVLWPFLLADLLLLGLAVLLLELAHRPLLWWEAALLVLCVAAAAASLMLPFLRRYAAEQALAQGQNLANAVAQIKKLEKLADQIGSATSLWQGVQEQAAQTGAVARDLTERMGTHAKSFADFLQQANDVEKGHLRLEVEKLRRSEAEWLQIITAMLDHTFALYRAAVRSGQTNLISQIGQFQNACRDAARRVGIVPLAPNPGDSFDARLHELAEGETAIGDKPLIAETVVAGISFQGQLVRRPVVRLEAETKS